MRRRKSAKGAGKGAAPAESAVVCSYSKRIGDAPPLPTAETHGPVVEKESAKTEAKAAAKPTAKKAAKKGGKKELQRALQSSAVLAGKRSRSSLRIR